MLSVYNNGVMYPIANDDYCIRRLSSGMDEVIFEINIHDENYPRLTEEASIVDRNLNYYLVKQVDAGSESAKIVAQIDVDDWKSELLISYNSGSKTVYDIINSIKPVGWRVVDNSGVTIRRTIQGSSDSQPYCVTPWEVVEECENVFNVRVIINNFTKILTLVNPDNYSSVGAFATKQLNLREINYKGKSQGFATRLYAYGKDNLTFAPINSGKAYVDDNTYSSRVICAYWKDERYTNAETLLADAKKRLHSMAVPQRSYDCDVIDLRTTNPELYGRQNFDLFQVITLLDNINKTAVDHQVVERWEYPYYPIRNKVILSTTVPKIQSQIAQVTNAINSPISTFQQMMNAILQSQTEMITGQSGGYVIMRDNDGDGKPDEILIMDTEDVATAVNVIRMNNSGIGFSVNGYDGPFRTAWTIDGQFTADNITGGTMSAGSIYGINIEGVYIEGSELRFGSDPYVQVRTNDAQTGVLFEGTGTVNFKTNGAFFTENYDSNGNQANSMRLFNSTASSSSEMYNYFNNIRRNYIDLEYGTSDGTTRSISDIGNYKSTSGLIANRHYMVSNDTNSFNQNYLSNYKWSADEVANSLSLRATSTRDEITLSNIQLGNTNYANYYWAYSQSDQNYMQLSNYKLNSSQFGNSITESVSATAINIGINNYGLNFNGYANRLTLNSNSVTNALAMVNNMVGSSTIANSITLSSGTSNTLLISNNSDNGNLKNAIVLTSGSSELQINNRYGTSNTLANQMSMTGNSSNGSQYILTNMQPNSSYLGNKISMISSGSSKPELRLQNFQINTNTVNGSITISDSLSFRCQNWFDIGFTGSDPQIRVAGRQGYSGTINGIEFLHGICVG